MPLCYYVNINITMSIWSIGKHWQPWINEININFHYFKRNISQKYIYYTQFIPNLKSNILNQSFYILIIPIPIIPTI